MTTRLYSVFDTVIIECDKAVKTIFGKPEITGRPVPGAEMKNNELPPAAIEKLIRIETIGRTSPKPWILFKPLGTVVLEKNVGFALRTTDLVVIVVSGGYSPRDDAIQH